jgi:DNA replication protein DnaC
MQYLVIERSWSGFFVNWASLLADIQSSWGTKDSGHTEQLYSSKIATRRLVVIDDVDKDGGPSKWSMKLLYNWVDTRTRKGLPTIFTANRGLEGANSLQDYWFAAKPDKPEEQSAIRDLAAATFSRMGGSAWGQVVLQGEDYRLWKP